MPYACANAYAYLIFTIINRYTVKLCRRASQLSVDYTYLPTYLHPNPAYRPRTHLLPCKVSRLQVRLLCSALTYSVCVCHTIRPPTRPLALA